MKLPPRAYDTAQRPSTRENDAFVSLALWRAVVGGLILVVAISAALVILLAAGLADPPRAANLILNARVTDGFPIHNEGDLTLVEIATNISPPFTLVVDASNEGRRDTAWGIYLRADDTTAATQFHLIHPDGYASSPFTPRWQWQQFPHIRPVANVISLHMDQTGDLTYRINQEISARGQSAVSSFTLGLALWRSPEIEWRSIRLYTG